MTRWEFKALQIPHRDGTYSSNVHIHPEDLETWCNKMGAEGWDFCETNTGSILLFKRPIGTDECPAWAKAAYLLLENIAKDLRRLTLTPARADPPA